MSNAIEGLKPPLVWKYFAELAKIPRCSKHEAAAATFVLDTAKKLGLSAKQDKSGNVIVKKPASLSREKVKSVCLQGHLDMVCEKNADKVHDFTKDPIELVRKGNVLTANSTTLGGGQRDRGGDQSRDYGGQVIGPRSARAALHRR